MIFGYGFWLIMAKVTTPSIIGTSGAVISLATIFITIATIGVPTGVQRFLGKSFSDQKIENSKVFVKASLVLVSIGMLASSILILVLKSWIQNTFAIDFSLAFVAILLIVSSSITMLFRSIVTASLKTRMLPTISIIAGCAKIGLGILLVFIGTGTLGVTIGFTSFSIISDILLAANLILIFRSKNNISEISFGTACKNILISSQANWVPALITTLGSQLGTIVVFGSRGASNAGVYFIAFSIFSALSALTSFLLTIAYPALSAMDDGRKRFAWRIIKMSLIIGVPFASSFIFYSKDIIQLFGKGYVDGSSTLEILLLTTIPSIVGSGINSLIYSRGNYRQVLTLGMAGSIPRVVLYFILVPIYGSVGAAMSYSIGSLIGFVVSIIYARMIGFQIFWKDLILILLIPMGLGFALSNFHVNFVFGIIITFLASCILFVKMLVINRDDIHDSVGILPSKVSMPSLKIVDIIAKKINKKY